MILVVAGLCKAILILRGWGKMSNPAQRSLQVSSCRIMCFDLKGLEGRKGLKGHKGPKPSFNDCCD